MLSVSMRNTKSGSDDTPKLMLGGRLQIPQGVLDAQRDGRLVVLAGAGVSKELPSGLPLFRELVEEIAGRKLFEAEKPRPDRLLGNLPTQRGSTSMLLPDESWGVTHLSRRLVIEA